MTLAVIPDDSALKNAAEQLIVCKTDPDGIITYANAAYIARSGLSEMSVLGTPLVDQLHPSMPKAIVRLMWSELDNKREVFTYLKYQSRDHNHYWVFANVTPGYDLENKLKEYFFVQRNPNGQALQVIEPIYEEMFNIEHAAGGGTTGMDRSIRVIHEAISQLGGNYEEFLLAL